jgi:hypothetical protein
MCACQLSTDNRARNPLGSASTPEAALHSTTDEVRLCSISANPEKINQQADQSHSLPFNPATNLDKQLLQVLQLYDTYRCQASVNRAGQPPMHKVAASLTAAGIKRAVPTCAEPLDSRPVHAPHQPTMWVSPIHCGLLHCTVCCTQSIGPKKGLPVPFPLPESPQKMGKIVDENMSEFGTSQQPLGYQLCQAKPCLQNQLHAKLYIVLQVGY